MHYGQMDSDSIQVLEARLEQEYFLPEILRSMKSRTSSACSLGESRQTGDSEFEVRNRRADIRWFSDTHVVIKMLTATNTRIPDLSCLDAASRRRSRWRYDVL